MGRFIAPWRSLKGQARKFKSVEPKPDLLIHPDEGKKKRPPTDNLTVPIVVAMVLFWLGL